MKNPIRVPKIDPTVKQWFFEAFLGTEQRKASLRKAKVSKGFGGNR